jgi:NDP-sugar pyrophosphorylase family protein
MKTVVIPAAGLGSRLSSFTKNYSKAMCTLGEKPVISHIIDKFNDNDEIIILLGYKGDLLKQVVSACHPNKNIKYVEVDNFDGPGSGLGYSLFCAYNLLQKPFIFWSCDTVLPSLDINTMNYNNNWAICSDCAEEYFTEYRHFRLNKDNKVIDILPKDVPQRKDILSYTGVSFIYDYTSFWKAYSDNKNAFIKDGETFGLRNLGHINAYRVTDWIDMGNKTQFEYYKKVYNESMNATILEKPDEAIWFVNGNVVKFHINNKFISDRVKRFKTMLCNAQIENGIMLPELIAYTDNTYTYKMAPGTIASRVINTNMLTDILESYLNVEIIDIEDDKKFEIFKDFYLDKTLQRIDKYCTEYTDIDNNCYINGIKCVPATSLVSRINWKALSKKGVFTNNYHGDFHLENILVNDDKYIMLDFRQNFGKSMTGDAYYDIAKMWHSFIVNHEMVKKDLFVVENEDANHVKIDIHRTFVDTECEKALVEWLDNSKVFDKDQADLMTAIIFLNIAACHVYPYSKFLFNLGKLMINNFYKKHYNNTEFFV